jgi:hypothetical protein
MSLEDWKASLSQLGPEQRNELIEFLQALNHVSGHSPPVQGSGTPRGTGVPSSESSSKWQGPVVIILIIVILAAGVGWAVGTWKKEQKIKERALAIKEQAIEEEAEARRPRSPTNMDFLRSQIGKEITIRGVPQASEVGMLFFHRDRDKGLQVEIFEPHVVLYQSTQLEEWVANQTELEVFGILETDPQTGGPMIDIKRQNQIRIVNQD